MLDAFLEHKDCEVTAICDIYQPYLDFSAKKSGTSTCVGHRDIIDNDCTHAPESGTLEMLDFPT